MGITDSREKIILPSDSDTVAFLIPKSLHEHMQRINNRLSV